jgi:hypothetical protein
VNTSRCSWNNWPTYEVTIIVMIITKTTTTTTIITPNHQIVY